MRLQRLLDPASVHAPDIQDFSALVLPGYQQQMHMWNVLRPLHLDQERVRVPSLFKFFSVWRDLNYTFNYQEGSGRAVGRCSEERVPAHWFHHWFARSRLPVSITHRYSTSGQMEEI